MYNCAKKRCMISINVISYLKCTLLLILEWVSHYLGEKEKYKSKSNCYRWFLHIHFLHGLRNELRKNYEIKRLSIIFAYASNSLALMAGYDRVERLTKTLPLRKITPTICRTNCGISFIANGYDLGIHCFCCLHSKKCLMCNIDCICTQ